MKKRIFICYRRATSSYFVERLVEKLRLNNKFDVYYDQNPKHKGSGGLWDLLKEDIDNSTHFVLVVDEKTFQFNGSIEEDMVWKEIDHALKKFEKNKKFKIIPISINGNEIPPKEFLKKYGIENFDKYTFIKADYNDSDGFDSFYSDFIKEKLEYDEPKEEKKKRIWQSILAILGAAFCVFGGTLLQQYITSKTQEPPKLVFAGGGSVANIIDSLSNSTADVKAYPNSLYLDMPSENAWALMSEEVLINHHDSVKNKFYPVCLSALEAKEKVFLKGVDSKLFLERGTIISYRFDKDDTLKVYSDNFKEQYGKITFDELAKIIKERCKNPLFKIYITKEGSGTYSIYKDKLKDIFDDGSFNKHLDYYDKNLIKKNLTESGGQYIVLSSQYYTPADLKNLKTKELVEVKNNGDTMIISKPMYLYFAGYTSKNSSHIRIPEQMVSFIKHFKKDNIIKSKMHQDTAMVITPLDSLINWEKKSQKSGNKQNVKKKK